METIIAARNDVRWDHSSQSWSNWDIWSKGSTREWSWIQQCYGGLTVVSWEQEAMMWSLNGFHLMSRTGPLWPHTLGALVSILPVWSKQTSNHNAFCKDITTGGWRHSQTSQLVNSEKWLDAGAWATAILGKKDSQFGIWIWFLRIQRWFKSLTQGEGTNARRRNNGGRFDLLHLPYNICLLQNLKKIVPGGN